MLGRWLRNRFYPPTAHVPATPSVNVIVSTPSQAAATAVLRKSTSASLSKWLNTTVRIKKGDYCPIEAGHKSIRVAVTDIKIASVPDKWGHAKDQPAVEVEVDLNGGVIFGGSATVSVGVNKHLLPRMEFEESAESIYAFHTTDDYFSFLRISVTHINLHDACADLNVVSVSINPR